MSVRVWQSGRFGSFADWEMTCATHLEHTTTGDWLGAMEAAWGHIAMHHGRTS